VIAVFGDRDSFEDEAFADLDLSRVDVTNKEFLRCTFTNVQLPDADLSGARLDECLFNSCDLSRARATNLAARGVAFVRCRLMGLDFSELRPTPSLVFEHCTLQYATFGAANLTGTRFTSCKLVEVNFFGTRLADADFTDSDLTSSRFDGCDLRGAQFAAARGFYADPSKNVVTGAHVNVETALTIAAVLGFDVDV
jgi:fluoroquinolone resistance protein